MRIFINNFMNNKSLEDCIRAIHEKYKNSPSPLSESNKNPSVNMVPLQTTPTSGREQLLKNFAPPSKTF
jgi:hypothetical protein